LRSFSEKKLEKRQAEKYCGNFEKILIPVSFVQTFKSLDKLSRDKSKERKKKRGKKEDKVREDISDIM